MSGSSARALRVNGREVPWEPGELGGLLQRLGYAADRAGLAVAVNGEVVPRAAWNAFELHAGDEVDIVGAVQGG